jgi:hypothetical protein
MVHHAAPQEVIDAVVAIDRARERRFTAARRTPLAPVPRHWLHIGEASADNPYLAQPLAADLAMGAAFAA